MTLKQCGFETGTVGSAWTTGTPGDPDSMSVAGLTAGGTITSTDAHAMHGSKGVLLSAPASGDKMTLGWLGWNTTVLTASAYLYVPGYPSGVSDLWVHRNSTGPAAKLQWSTDGKLRVVNAGGTTLKTFAGALGMSAFRRIEFSAAIGASTGTISCAYYDGDSTTPIDSYTSGATNVGSTNLVQTYLGFLTTGVTGSFYVDSMRAQDTADSLGPWTVPSYVRSGGAWHSIDQFVRSSGAWA